MHRLLIVDNSTFAENLAAHLRSRYDVDRVATADEAHHLRHHYDLFMLNPTRRAAKGLELLGRMRAQNARIPAVLIAPRTAESCLDIALRHEIFAILPETLTVGFRDIDIEIDALLRARPPRFDHYLLDGAEVSEVLEVRSSNQGREIRVRVEQMLLERCGTARDIKLLLDELITNAIYHGPRAADGTRVYTPFVQVTLAPRHRITVRWGLDSEKYGICVTDNAGTLRAREVLTRIARHSSGAGTADQRGRGLYMARTLADRMWVNITPNDRTELILMNYFDPGLRGHKPLFVNEF